MYEAGGALASWQGEKLTIVTDNAPTPEDRSALFGVSLPGLSEADTDWRGSMPSTIARSCMAGQSVPLAVILAWVVARPVRVHATAGAVASRAAQRVTARISTSRGGAVKSIHVTAHVDSGAYPIGFPPYAIRTGSVFRPGVVKTVVRISPSHTQPPVLIDHNLIEISFALQQAIDMAAKSHAQDPLAFRLRHVELPDVTKGLTEAARRFGWTSKWRGWSPQRQGRKRPGTGLALTGEGTAWVAAFIGLDVDMDVGTVTLGDCTLALICRGASSEEAELATQTGFGNGVAAALFLESTSPPCDRRQLHAGGLYHSRPSTVLDTPVIERLYFDSESVTTPSFSDIASLAAGATVAAIANGIRDATGMAPRTLPMSFDRLRQQWP
jgi:CO/xanthine dehydrogenase Mo-binding subunit